jgi:hypothetical protein
MLGLHNGVLNESFVISRVVLVVALLSMVAGCIPTTKLAKTDGDRIRVVEAPTTARVDADVLVCRGLASVSRLSVERWARLQWQLDRMERNP